jgi:hypothetical protein
MSAAQARPQTPTPTAALRLDTQTGPAGSFAQSALVEQPLHVPLLQTGALGGHGSVADDAQSPLQATHVLVVASHVLEPQVFVPANEASNGAVAHPAHVLVVGSHTRLEPQDLSGVQAHPAAVHELEAKDPNPFRVGSGHPGAWHPGVHRSSPEPWK